MLVAYLLLFPVLDSPQPHMQSSLLICSIVIRYVLLTLKSLSDFIEYHSTNKPLEENQAKSIYDVVKFVSKFINKN